MTQKINHWKINTKNCFNTLAKSFFGLTATFFLFPLSANAEDLQPVNGAGGSNDWLSITAKIPTHIRVNDEEIDPVTKPTDYNPNVENAWEIPVSQAENWSPTDKFLIWNSRPQWLNGYDLSDEHRYYRIEGLINVSASQGFPENALDNSECSVSFQAVEQGIADADVLSIDYPNGKDCSLGSRSFYVVVERPNSRTTKTDQYLEDLGAMRLHMQFEDPTISNEFITDELLNETRLSREGTNDFVLETKNPYGLQFNPVQAFGQELAVGAEKLSKFGKLASLQSAFLTGTAFYLAGQGARVVVGAMLLDYCSQGAIATINEVVKGTASAVGETSFLSEEQYQEAQQRSGEPLFGYTGSHIIVSNGT